MKKFLYIILFLLSLNTIYAQSLTEPTYKSVTVTKFLRVNQYNNTNPQNGDIWLWNDTTYIRILGTTYKLSTTLYSDSVLTNNTYFAYLRSDGDSVDISIPTMSSAGTGLVCWDTDKDFFGVLSYIPREGKVTIKSNWNEIVDSLGIIFTRISN